jgi:hypothetical protein
VPPTPEPPAPTPTPTLAERVTAWPGSRWAIGASVAALAIGVAIWALRLRQDVVGDGIAEER